MDGIQNATVSFVSGGKGKSDKKKLISIILIAIVAVAIIAVAVFQIIRSLQSNNTATETEEEASSTVISDELTEEDKTETGRVTNNLIDVEFVGYQQIEDELGQHGAVVTNVKNKSNDTLTVAVDVVAKDNDGNILDKSSLYAEGIGPGQTYSFNLFVYTALTEDQLKSAKYEVYKAYTYTAPSEAAGEASDANGAEAPAESAGTSDATTGENN